MPRRRMIDPNIWLSNDFSKLSMVARVVFIGMFSLADDEGRGRAHPAYIKSQVFPYDEGMRIIDIEKALSEIGQHLSVTYYSSDGSEYYCLDNWSEWQTINRPSPSKLPAPPDKNGTHKTFNEDSVNTHGALTDGSLLKEDKRKEEEEKEKYKEKAPAASLKKRNTFHPPTLQDVESYCRERGNAVDAKRFFDYYDSAGWTDQRGEKILSWKQKMIAVWEKNRNDSPQEGGKKSAPTERDYTTAPPGMRLIL